MIRHCVVLNLRAGANPGELAEVMYDLEQVCDRLDGATGFLHGPNRDFEGKSPDYPYGFTIDFTDGAALERYAVDPAHKACGARLVAMCEGGKDGITVFDLEIG